jgi:beta-N-acetylhexosaminidase
MRNAVTSVPDGGAGWGGLIFMRDNVSDDPTLLAGITAYDTADAELPPILSIDEEGGEVTRLSFDAGAGANVLRDAPPEATGEAFGERGRLLASLGFNVNFGVVADVTADPRSFIYARTLGSDAQASADRVAQAVSHEQPAVASTLKHFPGHGRTEGDSHEGIPVSFVSFEEWQVTDAVPFAAGIQAGARFVMFGHLAFPAVDGAPASMSAEWHRVLREELDFDGIAITDDMLMLQRSGDPEWSDPYANAIAALAAGNDALLYVLPADASSVGIDVNALVAHVASAVDAGTLSTARIDEAVLRMLDFRRRLAPGALAWHDACDFGCRVPAADYGTVPLTIALPGSPAP